MNVVMNSLSPQILRFPVGHSSYLFKHRKETQGQLGISAMFSFWQLWKGLLSTHLDTPLPCVIAVINTPCCIAVISTLERTSACSEAGLSVVVGDVHLSVCSRYLEIKVTLVALAILQFPKNMQSSVHSAECFSMRCLGI